jgi:hypothetical protein
LVKDGDLMDDYRVGFQKLFNERNNVEPPKFYIGEIIQVSPLKVSIMGGKAYFTEGQNLKVCQNLKISLIGNTSNGDTVTVKRTINVGQQILVYPLDSANNFVAFDIIA